MTQAQLKFACNALMKMIALWQIIGAKEYISLVYCTKKMKYERTVASVPAGRKQILEAPQLT